MKKYFTTGQFAKLANVTERTIRYYDKEGLLKPSFIMENGYRKYSQEDFIYLQHILSLKQLGFSLDEIKVMKHDDISSFKDSLQLQIDLLDKKIKHSQILKDSLIRTLSLLSENKSEISWNKIMELIQISNEEEKIIEHYKNANNLSVRIRLHNQYSINKVGWFPWLFSMIDLSKVNRLLEVGCGTGELWKSYTLELRNREVFLTDVSEGMVENARADLGEQFNYMIMDAQKIPFKNNYFDTVIANHVLFYLQNVEKGIEEIARVINKDGLFYCSTYGEHHMKEISELVEEFDDRIILSHQKLYESFGLDNGEALLKKYFTRVEKMKYIDELHVDNAMPLYDYILSCHGNQLDLLKDRSKEFRKFIEEKIKQEKYIHITKDAGLFICKK